MTTGDPDTVGDAAQGAADEARRAAHGVAADGVAHGAAQAAAHGVVQAAAHRDAPDTPDTADTSAVVVVGAVNVDLVVAAPRLPGPGETVVGPRLVRHGGGKGANAAVAAARAGAVVRLVGAVGADDVGGSATDELRAEGIDLDGVAVLEGEATGVALIVVDPAGENQIAVGAGANAALTTAHVRSAFDALDAAAAPRTPAGSGARAAVGCVLVSTEIPGPTVDVAVRAALAAGVVCVLNPAPVLAEVLPLLELGPILTPNRTELVDLVELCGAEVEEFAEATEPDRVAAQALALWRRSGAAVVVTLGGDGVLRVDAHGAVARFPARTAVARDTTGAGDTFNGVLAARLAAGDGLDDAVRVAMAAASMSVEHLGARDGMPRLAELNAALATP